MLARAFGWTPAECEAAPAVTVQWLLAIEALRNKLENEAKSK